MNQFSYTNKPTVGGLEHLREKVSPEDTAALGKFDTGEAEVVALAFLFGGAINPDHFKNELGGFVARYLEENVVTRSCLGGRVEQVARDLGIELVNPAECERAANFAINRLLVERGAGVLDRLSRIREEDEREV